MDRENGFPLGIAETLIWNRDWNKQTKKKRKYHSLPIEEKESYRWIECSETSQKVMDEAASITIVADREGDIYEEFVKVPDERTHLLIRSLHNRKLYDINTNTKLFEHLSNLEPTGHYDLEIKKSQNKRVPRQTKMEVRYDKIKIARPSNLSQLDYPKYIEL